jgi:hypothetical protein
MFIHLPHIRWPRLQSRCDIRAVIGLRGAVGAVSWARQRWYELSCFQDCCFGALQGAGVCHSQVLISTTSFPETSFHQALDAKMQVSSWPTSAWTPPRPTVVQSAAKFIYVAASIIWLSPVHTWDAVRRPAGTAHRRSLVGRLAVSGTSSTGGQSDVSQASAGGQRHRLANSYVDNNAPAAGELQLDMQGHKVGGCAG